MAGGAAPGASRNAALLYFIKAFVGPGCLSLPLAFQNAGLELGLVTLLTLAIGVTLNLRTLVLCKRYYATNGPPPTPGGRPAGAHPPPPPPPVGKQYSGRL